MYNQKPIMTVRYEINPPKISDDGQNVRNVLFERIKIISSVCNGIHLTDSVLGIPRVSPFKIARQIRESNKNIKLTRIYYLLLLLNIMSMINTKV